MEIAIKISDEDYKAIAKGYLPYGAIAEAIRNGTPLPEHHGDLIDRNELLDESYQIDSMYCEYDEVVNVDDIKDAPTIIGGGVRANESKSCFLRYMQRKDNW